MVEPLQGWVDETGWLKQGIHSVGVSHQYCGAVGKQPQCQVAVEKLRHRPAGAGVICRRVGAKDQVLRKGAGVPAGVAFQTKPAVAGDLIEEALGDG